MLGNADAIHTRRWASVLLERGHDVRVFSLEAPPAEDGSAPVTVLPHWPVPRFARYPLARPRLLREVDAFAPDLLEAHFVPNYGVLGASLGRHPLAVHAWGSDLLVNAARRANSS